MTEPLTDPQQCGGSPKKIAHDATQGQDAPPAPARAVGAPARAVRAWIAGSDDDRAVRKARAKRRTDLFAIFFQHQPGTLDEKRAQAHRLMFDRVTDEREREKLHGLLGRLLAIVDACPSERD